MIFMHLGRTEPYRIFQRGSFGFSDRPRTRRCIKHSINLDTMQILSGATATELKLLAIRGGKVLTSGWMGRFDSYGPSTGCFDELPSYLAHGDAISLCEEFNLAQGNSRECNAVGWRLHDVS